VPSHISSSAHYNFPAPSSAVGCFCLRGRPRLRRSCARTPAHTLPVSCAFLVCCGRA